MKRFVAIARDFVTCWGGAGAPRGGLPVSRCVGGVIVSVLRDWCCQDIDAIAHCAIPEGRAPRQKAEGQRT